ncbi:MAG: MBL fold metallo-hydrolase [Lachnoclostridium sp.]|nr:MBL fold metallo-hydrolase [Lachnospira sp.]MCM1249243.1 MBL fold metallo-hydrolase [Lachnoclostridium sp.]MCM1536571.1 MBL fold metallo-hydrolase [Clostridium sp.]
MGEIKIGRVVLGMYSTNCYFVYRENQSEAIVVDAPDYGQSIYENLARNGLHVAGILLTHGHFDHVWGVEDLKKAANEKAAEEGRDQVLVYAGEDERELLADPHKNVSEQMHRPVSLSADVYVKDQEEITIAGMTCKVIATPGHTKGGCCYYFEEAGFLLCGDTLFLESVGRTDFPSGSMGTLVRSIREKLFLLPEETKVYPGHGDSTTIGHEKKYNPFVA